ncbi:MAG: aspartyl protease family protein [Chloroflexota bacterium]
MARGDRVPLLPTRGVVLVRASLNGQSGFDLIVDSGASQMVISRSAASRLGIDLSKPLRQ